MSAIQAWASANPLLAGLLCVLVIAAGLLAAGVVVPWCVREWRDLGPKGDPARHARTAATTGPPAVHHDGHVQPVTRAPAVPLPPEFLAAPWPGDGFRAALAMNKRAEDKDAGIVPAPENVPGRPADPAGDLAPGPGGHPEGDTHLSAWPPQGAPGPGGLPCYAGYEAGLKAAATERKRIEAAALAEAAARQAELRAEAERTSPWKDRPPLAEAMGFSADTLVRIDARKLMADVEEYGKRVSAA